MKKILIILGLIICFQADLLAQCSGNTTVDNANAVECHTNAKSIKKAVAEVYYGSFRGTGAVVNNTNNDGRYLFLTSSQGFSCVWPGSTPAVGSHVSGISFYWEVELGSCQDPSIAVTTSGGASTSGATLLAIDNEFAIFELDDKPPFTKVMALGWDLTGNDPSSSFSIMHVYGLDTPDATIRNIYKAVLEPKNGIDYGSAEPYCWSTSGSAYYSGGNPDYLIDEFTQGGPAPLNTSNTYSVGGPLLGSNKRIYGTYQTGDAAFCNWGDAYFEKLQFMSTSVKNILTNGQSVTSHHGITFTPCEDYHNINYPVTNNLTKKASIRITASSEIIDNIVVRYQAGKEIKLEDGFISGTDFIAEIEPCDFEFFATISKTDGSEEVYNENISNSNNARLNKVYPTINKANGIVNIDFYNIDFIRQIKLFNVQGQLIINRTKVVSNSTEIKLPDNIDKGVYILKIIGGKNQIQDFKILVE